MAEKRANIILNYIIQKKEVTLRELCALFPDYTEMTIRRDLNLLEKNGYLTRTRGGARINEETISDYFTHRHRVISELSKKEAIAVKAMQFITPSSSVYFDSGTTVLQIAKMLSDISLFVTTNGPVIALELQRFKNIEVILTGGSLNKEIASTSGPIALEALDKVNIDTAFMGAAGISVDHGFTNAVYNECELKRKALACAKKKIMLIDSTKIGKCLPYTFGNIAQMDVIITDKPLPDELQEQADKAGVTVIY